MGILDFYYYIGVLFWGGERGGGGGGEYFILFVSEIHVLQFGFSSRQFRLLVVFIHHFCLVRANIKTHTLSTGP